jgi:diguanylate cyclase (GGDEF)-like protein
MYVIPAIIAFYIALLLRKKTIYSAEGATFAKVLRYLCIAEGIHSSYYFIATLMRNYDEGVYEAMLLPMPWLFAQGVIAVTFSVFGFYFLRAKDIAIGDITNLKRMANKFRELAFIDPLTNLSNRRALEEILPREKVRADRMYRPFTLMMLDLDGFRTYNDSFGPQAGDTLLVSLAGTIKANIRSEVDIPFRYGGDEFLVILPETVLSEASVIAKRLNASIGEITHETITLSIGLLEILPESKVKIGDLVRLADMVMYRAKREGGGRISSLTL